MVTRSEAIEFLHDQIVESVGKWDCSLNEEELWNFLENHADFGEKFDDLVIASKGGESAL